MDGDVESVLELAMEWLSPQDLASLAGTCKRLAEAVKLLSEARVVDVAQGMERWRVPVRNDLDSCRYPWFGYTLSCCFPTLYPYRCRGRNDLPEQHQHSFMHMRQLEQLGVSASWVNLQSAGCRCAGNCQLNDECRCGRTSNGLKAYTPKAKLQILYRGEEYDEEPPDVDDSDYPRLIWECGGACSCNRDCCHRVTQQGLSVRVLVARQNRTGWGLYAAQHISKGAFICDYAGELLPVQCQGRQDIDVNTTKVGNVARFINNACDRGNLLPCRVRAAGSLLPRLVFFARRDIPEGEESQYSCAACGNFVRGALGEVLPCYCGTEGCLSFLPSWPT